MKKIFTNGCFDLLHHGHLDLLFYCKSLGDLLIVGINSDASVRKLKGDSRPINSEDFRKRLLETLTCVDKVITFDELTPENLIRQVRPDILVKGGDYCKSNIIGSDFVESYGGSVKIYPLLEGYSSSHIITSIIN